MPTIISILVAIIAGFMGGYFYAQKSTPLDDGPGAAASPDHPHKPRPE